MQEYPVGTKEYFIVDVADRLQNLLTLDGLDLSFDIFFRETGDAKYSNEGATNEVMKVLCLVDTTDWVKGIYEMYITIVATPESPRLGPFEFLMI